MTPAEAITRGIASRIEASGATIPVESLLLMALEGEKKTSASSGIVVECHVAEQPSEPVAEFAFDVAVRIAASLDDDKSGRLFAENYEAVWNALLHFVRGDACRALGSGSFSANGFYLTGGEAPDYQSGENGGTWTTTFTATVAGHVA